MKDSGHVERVSKQEKVSWGKKTRIRQKTTCGWMESLLKLGSKEMEKEKNSSVKSNKRGGQREKKLRSVSGETFVNTGGKGLNGSRTQKSGFLAD